jgi:hypothetical protein
MDSKKHFTPNHYRFVNAFKHKVGPDFKTAQIIEIMSPKYILNRTCVRPNSHGVGNKDACPCAGTENRIFVRIGYGMYRVRSI